MTIHTTPQKTAAETALLDQFAARASELSGDAAIVHLRDDAMEQLKAGLPTRRVEAWHYTDLRRLLSAVPDPLPTGEAPRIEALVDGATVLSIDNGAAIGEPPTIEGVTVRRLADMLLDGSFGDALGANGADDTIGALNTAFVSDGWFIDVASNTSVAAPIEVQNLLGGGQAHVRIPVRVGSAADVTVVERQAGQGFGLGSSISHLTVGDGAKVTWIIVQEQPDDCIHLGQFNAELGENSLLRLFIFNAGGKVVRQEVIVEAGSEGSDFQLRGVNLLSGTSHVDVTMQLAHLAPHTTSTEVIRNVVTDRAHGVFQGQIRVSRDAQKTDAKMACNTLLLSDEAEFSTKPELEIFADDVACGHGATITEIDRNHLFYLMARGIDERTARSLLIKAFVAEIVDELEDEPLVEALEAKLDAWFLAHG